MKVYPAIGGARGVQLYATAPDRLVASLPHMIPFRGGMYRTPVRALTRASRREPHTNLSDPPASLEENPGVRPRPAAGILAVPSSRGDADGRVKLSRHA